MYEGSVGLMVGSVVGSVDRSMVRWLVDKCLVPAAGLVDKKNVYAICFNSLVRSSQRPLVRR